MHWECFGSVYIYIFHHLVQPPYTYILTPHYGYGIVLCRRCDVIMLCYVCTYRVREQDIFLHQKVPSEYYACTSCKARLRQALNLALFAHSPSLVMLYAIVQCPWAWA